MEGKAHAFQTAHKQASGLDALKNQLSYAETQIRHLTLSLEEKDHELVRNTERELRSRREHEQLQQQFEELTIHFNKQADDLASARHQHVAELQSVREVLSNQLEQKTEELNQRIADLRARTKALEAEAERHQQDAAAARAELLARVQGGLSSDRRSRSLRGPGAKAARLPAGN